MSQEDFYRQLEHQREERNESLGNLEFRRNWDFPIFLVALLSLIVAVVALLVALFK